MSVQVTKTDQYIVERYVRACWRLKSDYREHYALQHKKEKEEKQKQEKQKLEDEKKAAPKTMLETATETLSQWWNSWGSKEEKEEKEPEEKKEPSFEEKVAEILVAIVEFRAEEVANGRIIPVDDYKWLSDSVM